MDISFQILFFGTIALLIWGTVFWRALRTPLQWSAPTALFATGLLLLNILPALYWPLRPWSYKVPPYFDGLPTFLRCVILFGLPFLWVQLTARPLATSFHKPLITKLRVRAGIESTWLFFVPVIIGVAFRYYLLTLGFQARLERDAPTLFGSEQLAFLVSNVSYYYPVCYFAVLLFGNVLQKRIATGVWVLDGLFNVVLLHRYALLIYLLRSAIFTIILGWRFSFRHKLFVFAALILVVTVIGRSHSLAPEATTGGRSYLTPAQVIQLLADSTSRYSEGDVQEGYGSTDPNVLWRAIDDTMFRLYDARSASAVVENVPGTIPFFYGETFLDILYAMIPRIIWRDKPDISAVHQITTWVMPGDIGVNPIGTVAEFFINFSYPLVFLGGAICCFICRFVEVRLLTRPSISGAALCVYPVLAELFLSQSLNFTQRISEGLRGLLVYYLLLLMMRFLMGPQMTHSSSTARSLLVPDAALGVRREVYHG